MVADRGSTELIYWRVVLPIARGCRCSMMQMRPWSSDKHHCLRHIRARTYPLVGNRKDAAMGRRTADAMLRQPPRPLLNQQRRTPCLQPRVRFVRRLDTGSQATPECASRPRNSVARAWRWRDMFLSVRWRPAQAHSAGAGYLRQPEGRPAIIIWPRRRIDLHRRRHRALALARLRRPATPPRPFHVPPWTCAARADAADDRAVTRLCGGRLAAACSAMTRASESEARTAGWCWGGGGAHALEIAQGRCARQDGGRRSAFSAGICSVLGFQRYGRRPSITQTRQRTLAATLHDSGASS